MKYFLARLSAFLLASIVGLIAASAAFGSASIVIQNNDQPGVGFNDTTPATPVGGNNGTTIGEQRLIAFQAAANIWGATLTSGPTITIRARWEALPCTTSSGTLGSSGSTSLSNNFANATFTNTWYGVALANALAGSDLNGATAEISAQFNFNIGTRGCLDSKHWYYGLDNNHGTSGIDLFTLLLHEFAHGLGFASFTDVATGEQAGNTAPGYPSVFDRFLLDTSTGKTWPQMTNAERQASAINAGNLVWNGIQVTTDAVSSLTSGKNPGGYPLVFAPNPISSGSSVSHWDTKATPNQLMEPNITNSLGHGVTASSTPPDLTYSLLRDIGWCPGCPQSPPPSPIVQFSGPSYTFNESDGQAILTVFRSGDTNGAASVDYRTTDTDTFTSGCAAKQGSAYGRCDFATMVGTLSFAAGETSKSIFIPIINDTYAEGNETFSVILSNPTSATLGSQSTATVTINDNESVNGPNPVLLANDAGIDFFVRQHYLDFLGREPETGEPWSGVLRGCANQFNTDPSSPSASCDRIAVSGAFFGSPEFKNKGLYIIDFYRVAFNRLPTYSEFAQDLASITGATAAEANARRAAFAGNFLQRAEFTNAYNAMSNAGYVSALISGQMGQGYFLTSITTPDPANPEGTTKVTLTTADLINRLNAATLTRAQVLRAIVQSDQISLQLEAVNALVASQYYGYLRRTPDAGGFNGWVTYLKNNPSDFRTMVNGFVNSTEYRLRFGPP